MEFPYTGFIAKGVTLVKESRIKILSRFEIIVAVGIPWCQNFTKPEAI